MRDMDLSMPLTQNQTNILSPSSDIKHINHRNKVGADRGRKTINRNANIFEMLLSPEGSQGQDAVHESRFPVTPSTGVNLNAPI